MSAIFVGAKERADALRLQREINDETSEPLTAVLPGVALSELWQTLDYAESGLRLIAIAVLLVGFLGMLIALYTTLESRRREMAILRALGARPWKIVALLVLEAGLLSIAGTLLGVVLLYGGLLVAQPLA
ncbi:MAG: FtsX-like permease family protein, partial [Acidobacteriota bacterium]